MNTLEKLREFSFSRNKEFLGHLFRLAIPVILQNMTLALLQMIDVVMVGQLGETAIAAVGISNQAVFLLSMFMAGINTGTAVMISQHWGARDVRAIRSFLGLALKFSSGMAVVFFIIGRFFPRHFIGIYSNDPAVIEAGIQYMSITAFSYLCVAVTQSFAAAHRATESVKLPMVTGILGVCTNTLLNYCLIGGNMGFPALGIQGAAVATAAACGLEVTALLSVTYIRKMIPAANFSEFRLFRKNLIRDYLKVVAPVVGGELFWALGEAQFQLVYARMGTAVIAGMSIFSSIQRLTVVIIGGVAGATSIIVGKSIGEGNHEKASSNAKRCMLVTGIMGAVLLIGLFLLRKPALSFFNVSADVKLIAFNVLGVYCIVGNLRYLNYTSIAGVLRGGGDTRFAMLIDTVPLWVSGVPLAYIFGLGFGWPAHWLYMVFIIEQTIKLVLGLRRMASGKWIHDLVNTGT
jgi:putative MATE family efflux protein